MRDRRRHNRFNWGVLVLLLSAAAASACRKQAPEPAAAPAPQPVASVPAADSVDPRDAARRDSIAREERLRAEREQRLTAARNTLMQPVYFDYDRAELSGDARSVLDAKVQLLTRSQEVRLRITGHADERGSDEYNLALGQRRAAAVKRYLVDHGIAAARLDILSLGEERPICTEAFESCWSRNRRGEFEIVAGDDRIVTQ
jgi:peptidoglycan-associated lipoprotein